MGYYFGGSPHDLWLRIAAIITGLALLPFITPDSPAMQGEDNDLMKPQQREIVMRWLAVRNDLRLAVLSDCKNQEGLEITKSDQGANYNPYYIQGDFNGDKREDFAVVMVSKKKRTRIFTIAIFNGSAGTRKTTGPSFILENCDLSRGGLILSSGGGSRKRLLAGTFQSDECVILQPRGNTYIARDCGQ